MITEEKIKRLVSLLVERKIQMLKEGHKMQAIRSLSIQAQQAALKFEESMLDALEITDPDELSPDEQRIYSQAMNDMHSKIIEAVTEAAGVVQHLQGRVKENEAAKKAKPKTAETAGTVQKDLPTL
jgi:hypothetical protein